MNKKPKISLVISVTLLIVLLSIFTYYLFIVPEQAKLQKATEISEYLEKKYDEKFVVKETCDYSYEGGPSDYMFVVQNSTGERFKAYISASIYNKSQPYFDNYKGGEDINFHGDSCKP